VAQPQQHALARAIGPQHDRARPACDRHRDAVDDPVPARLEHDAVEP
jgi:hypothetical protein